MINFRPTYLFCYLRFCGHAASIKSAIDVQTLSKTKFSVYKTKILLFKSKKKHEIFAHSGFLSTAISVFTCILLLRTCYST